MPIAKGQVAAIFGSATGIGRAAARKWGSNGVKLALFDKNDAVNKVAEELQGSTDVFAFVGDMSKLDDVTAFRDAVKKQFGKVDLAMINAGVQVKSAFDDVKPFHDTFAVNFFGVVNSVSVFEPWMKEQGTPAHIVITGSKQGITNPPGNPAYNASKAAVKSFAEGLSYAHRDTSIDVHLLVPGWTYTALTGNRDDSDNSAKPAGAWLPEQVVDELDKGIDAGNFYILCPDNEVTVDMDKKRVEWGAGDIVHNRPALSRWRPEFADEFKKFSS